jgi:Zn-dependent protease
VNWESALTWYIALIISLTFHEASHALFAKLGGDSTAYRLGQVTLNPIPHMQREPFGMIVFPILSLWMSQGSWCIGFASTPIDPFWAYSHPKRAALMSAAGPLANLVLASIAFALIYFLQSDPSNTARSVVKIAHFFLLLNLLLAVFNLIPLPPLDGAGIVSGLVPATRNLYENLARIPYMGLIVLIVVIQVLPYLYDPVYQTVRSWLR